ncbi:MAG TPA: polyprenol monophosphomannose synthase [Vicinamibacterales bacterium]|nr:polyprenol monophosphomannose synthase [Vicinamibacterales bacterium]
MNALVIIPTYNERENIPPLVEQLLQHDGVRVLVVDDHSPDGTGEVADRLAGQHPGRVEVLHRTARRGFGRSYVDGIKHAITQGADLICQMDADFSHDPARLPALLASAADADVVIGSRYVPGGSVVNWRRRRLLLSRFANVYVRAITHVEVHDCTSGYRCWRRRALESLPLDELVSDGYSFLVEMLFVAARQGRRIVEIPITYVERREGQSKMSRAVILESAITPWRLIASPKRARPTDR